MIKSTILAGLASVVVQRVAGHATWQELWVNGVDMISNINQGAPAYKCVVSAGSTVTIEMHQQPGDRSCANEAIGGAHYGPVLAYMSKVSDSTTADGSTGWFKIFQDTWARASSTSSGSDDYWGTKDLNTYCGKMDVKIPSDLAPGDYLLRAEAIALHSASSAGGAQFYMSCFQLTVTGGGSASPAAVKFPGAYAASDPGIQINIYQSLSTYVAPGPTVASDGTTVQAGKGGSTVTASGGNIATITGTGGTVSSTAASSTGGAGCNVAKYGQCGGSGYTGCTTCVSGSTCSILNDYYSQCS